MIIMSSSSSSPTPVSVTAPAAAPTAPSAPTAAPAFSLAPAFPLEATVEALHQSCLWCKEKDAGTFLSFLEGECEEVREGLDKLDELRERQTQALEQTSEEQAVARAVVSSSNEDARRSSPESVSTKTPSVENPP